MAKYKDIIEWIAENWDLDTIYRWEELDPNADVVRMIRDVFNKPVEKIAADLKKELWEQDNLNRGNI